ncbi:MAG: type II toxin-antitoxin system VapC family toxin [Rhodanobacteraceae bacterium]
MAARYLLDSCILISFAEGRAPKVASRLAGLATIRIVLSSIVFAELATGAAKSRDPATALSKLAELANNYPPLPFDADDAFAYGRIRATLERKGASIGPMDLLIAAQAVARGLVLVTDNLREFRRVPGLQCENWMR